MLTHYLTLLAYTHISRGKMTTPSNTNTLPLPPYPNWLPITNARINIPRPSPKTPFDRTRSSDLGRDDMGYNPELPVGGAFDIGRLDGSSSMTMDNGSNNGSASSEFYHSGKNKGSLRFDRYWNTVRPTHVFLKSNVQKLSHYLRANIWKLKQNAHVTCTIPFVL